MPVPTPVAPSANADDSAGEDTRQSRPTTSFEAPVHRPNARPIRKAASSSNWSGYVPRMSYALKMQ